MDDLDRPLDFNSRRNFEHKAVGEEGSIERREGAGRRIRCDLLDHWADQIGALSQRLTHRAEP